MFKAINDTILPEAFKAKLERNEQEDVITNCRDFLLRAYNIYKEEEEFEEPVLAILLTIQKEKVLEPSNQRSIKELQTKYLELCLLLAEVNFSEVLSEILFSLTRVFPDFPPLLRSLAGVLIQQKKFIQAFHISKKALKFSPFEKDLMIVLLHSLYNCCNTKVFERYSEKLSIYVKYEPKLEINQIKELEMIETSLTIKGNTWNAVLSTLTDFIIAKGRVNFVWSILINRIEIKLEVKSEAPQSIQELENDELISSSQVKKRAASAKAKKNLKRPRVIKKNPSSGIDLIELFRKFDLHSDFIGVYEELCEKASNRTINLPPISEFNWSSLENKVFNEVMIQLISNMPEEVYCINEFIPFFQAIVSKGGVDLFSNSQLVLIYKLSNELRLSDSIELIEHEIYHRNLQTTKKSERPTLIERIETKETISEALEEFLASFNPQSFILVLNVLMGKFREFNLINLNSSIVALICLLAKNHLQDYSDFIVKASESLLLTFGGNQDFVYEFALIFGRSELLTLSLARKCAELCKGDKKWEIVRSIFELNKIVENELEPVTTIQHTDSKPNLMDCETILGYLVEKWESLDSKVDENALLKGIEFVIRSIKPSHFEQRILETNQGILKRYFRTECRDLFDIHPLKSLFKINQPSRELELITEALKLRIGIFEEAFAGRKRNVEWLRSFKGDAKKVLLLGEDTWELLELIHKEIASQLLALEPIMIRGRINKIRRNLKKTLICTRNIKEAKKLPIAVMFMMLHGFGSVPDPLFRQRALKALIYNVTEEPNDLFLSGFALLDSYKYRNMGLRFLLHAAESERVGESTLYLILYTLRALGKESQLEEQLMKRFPIVEREKLMETLAPNCNLHFETEHIFPILQKPKGQTFCGLVMPGLVPGFGSWFLHELTKLLISKVDWERLVIIINRLRVLEAQLVDPESLIVQTAARLLKLSSRPDETFGRESVETREFKTKMLESILKELVNNRSIERIQPIISKMKELLGK